MNGNSSNPLWGLYLSKHLLEFFICHIHFSVHSWVPSWSIFKAFPTIPADLKDWTGNWYLATAAAIIYVLVLTASCCLFSVIEWRSQGNRKVILTKEWTNRGGSLFSEETIITTVIWVLSSKPSYGTIEILTDPINMLLYFSKYHLFLKLSWIGSHYYDYKYMT